MSYFLLIEVKAFSAVEKQLKRSSIVEIKVRRFNSHFRIVRTFEFLNVVFIFYMGNVPLVNISKEKFKSVF